MLLCQTVQTAKLAYARFKKMFPRLHHLTPVRSEREGGDERTIERSRFSCAYTVSKRAFLVHDGTKNVADRINALECKRTSTNLLVTGNCISECGQNKAQQTDYINNFHLFRVPCNSAITVLVLVTTSHN
jgi:hypothetical protein